MIRVECALVPCCGAGWSISAGVSRAERKEGWAGEGGQAAVHSARDKNIGGTAGVEILQREDRGQQAR